MGNKPTRIVLNWSQLSLALALVPMASSALLAQIQQGKALKKAVTNDRSAPLVDGAAKKGPSAGSALASAPSVGASSTGSGVSLGGAGPPQLGGLFAGGIPKLKPTQGGPGAYKTWCILLEYFGR